MVDDTLKPALNCYEAGVLEFSYMFLREIENTMGSRVLLVPHGGYGSTIDQIMFEHRNRTKNNRIHVVETPHGPKTIFWGRRHVVIRNKWYNSRVEQLYFGGDAAEYPEVIEELLDDTLVMYKLVT